MVFMCFFQFANLECMLSAQKYSNVKFSVNYYVDLVVTGRL